MGLLINLSLLICTGFLSVDSRGLLAPKKKGAVQVKNTTAKVTDDDEKDEMAPPMEPFEEVDSDVDEDADKKEMQVEEDELKGHNPGKMFGLHEVGQKDSVNKQQRVDPMEAVHNDRLGQHPKVRKAAAPAQQVKKSQAPAKGGSPLNALKDLVGEVDGEAPKPVAKPEQKKAVEAVPENITAAVSAETAAQVEKMKEWREKEKAAAKTTTTTTAAPKKPHNLGKDLAKISAEDMAPLDDKVVAKLKEAMPSAKKPTAPVQAVNNEHAHGDAIGRLHSHALSHKLEAGAATMVHTTTAAPAQRRATPQQLAAARRASALTDALRNVNASEVELNLDMSEEAAKKIRNIEAKVKKETDNIDKALKPAPVDHMEELRATAEKALDAKVQHLAEKKAKKAAAKQEPVSKLAEALGINDKEAEAIMTTTATPSKSLGDVASDPIKALHQRIVKTEPIKQVESPKATPKPVVQQPKVEEPEAGIMSGFHHNKANDKLAPVLR